jgi:hypothetical protein
MIPELRKKFNSEFTQAKYDAFLNDLNTLLKYPVDFRISETPLFLSSDLKSKIILACNELCKQVTSNEFKVQMKDAVPAHLDVPAETDHPELFVFDFAICKNETTGEYYPKLIELQGFPTLYSYQYFFERKIGEYFNLPENYTPYFNGITSDEYVKIHFNSG